MLYTPATQLTCTRCFSHAIQTDYEEGVVVCVDCGEIINERIIDDTPDWRQHSHDDYYDGNAHSRASLMNMDQHSSTVLTGNVRGFSELVRVHESVSKRDDDKVNLILPILSDFSHRLKLSARIHDATLQLCRRALTDSSQSFTRGKEYLVAAAIYAACRKEGFPRAIKEVSQAVGLDKAMVGKSHRHLATVLGLDAAESTVHRVKPEDLVERIASKLQFSFALVDETRQYCRKASSAGVLEGSQPTVIAAAILLWRYALSIAPGQVSKGFLSSVCEAATISTTVTLMKAYAQIRLHQSILDPSAGKQEDDSPSKKQKVEQTQETVKEHKEETVGT